MRATADATRHESFEAEEPEVEIEDQFCDRDSDPHKYFLKMNGNEVGCVPEGEVVPRKFDRVGIVLARIHTGWLCYIMLWCSFLLWLRFIGHDLICATFKSPVDRRNQSFAASSHLPCSKVGYRGLGILSESNTHLERWHWDKPCTETRLIDQASITKM